MQSNLLEKQLYQEQWKWVSKLVDYLEGGRGKVEPRSSRNWNHSLEIKVGS